MARKEEKPLPDVAERNKAAAFARKHYPNAKSIEARLSNPASRDDWTAALCEMHGITPDDMRRARLG